MDPLKKQILFELCVTPYTVVPFTLGCAFGLLSFVIPPLSLLAFLGIGGSVAALLANIALNSKNVEQRATKRWHKRQKQDKDKELDDLDKKLVKDRDPRTQNYLRDLRNIYGSFVTDQSKGKIKARVSPAILDRIDAIFDTCVHSLSNSYELWEQSTKMSDTMRGRIEDKRNQILDDVGENVTRLFEAISEVRALGLQSSGAELDRLQKRLQDDLEIARQVDKMASVGVGDDLSEYDDYLKE